MISYNNVIIWWMKKMIYKKIDIKNEINNLKQYHIASWTGHKLKHLTVTIETNGEKTNLKYYITDPKDYSYFINQLRKLEE